MLLWSILTTIVIVFFYRHFSKDEAKKTMDYPVRRPITLIYHIVVAVLLAICLAFSCLPWIIEDQFFDLVTLKLFQKSTDSTPAAMSFFSMVLALSAIITNVIAILKMIAQQRLLAIRYLLLMFVTMLSVSKMSEIASLLINSSGGDPYYIVILEAVCAGSVVISFMIASYLICDEIADVQANVYFEMDNEENSKAGPSCRCK